MSIGSTSVKIVDLQKVGDSRNGYSMNMRIVTKTRGVGSAEPKVHEKVSADKKRRIDTKSVSLARIREWTGRLGRKGEECWIYTFTYSVAVHSPKVAVTDLRSICKEGDRIGAKVMGVWELHSDKDGQLGHGLHLHVVSNKQLDKVLWTKGRWSEKAVTYNAVSAENYLGKQWKGSGSYLVKWRGDLVRVNGLSEYRKLWKNVQHCVCSKALLESPVVRERSEGELSKGELFTVVLEDLKCVPAYKLDSVDYIERASCLSLRRSSNGTLFASNNCDKPSRLVKWLLTNRKKMIVELYKKAHSELRERQALREYVEL